MRRFIYDVVKVMDFVVNEQIYDAKIHHILIYILLIINILTQT